MFDGALANHWATYPKESAEYPKKYPKSESRTS